MRRALRWLKRFVLAFLAITFVAVTAALIVLHTDWGRDKARTIVLAQIQQFFPGGIHVERIDGSVLGQVRLTNLTINGYDKQRMITARSARANLKYTALFSGRIELEYVELEDVDVVNPGNPVWVDPTTPPFGWDVALPKISVRRARVTVAGEQPMTFENVELDAAVAVTGGGGPIDVSANVGATWREYALPLSVKANANITERVVVRSLDAVAGDSTIAGKELVVDLARPTGTLVVHATPGVLAKLAPQIALPAPVDVRIDLADTGTESRVEVAATMKNASLQATLLGDLDKLAARGTIVINDVDLATIAPSLTGSGSGVIAVTADQTRANVTAIVRGQLLDLPAGHAVVGVDATRTSVRAILVAGGAGGTSTTAAGELAIDGDDLKLVDSTVLVKMKNPSVVTAGKIPFRGPLRLAGTAKGPIAPKLALELTGEVEGYGLASTDPKLGDLRIARVSGSASGSITEAGTYSRFRATVKDVSRGGSPLGTFEIDGRNRKDGKIALTLTARPAAIPNSVATIDSVISLGQTETDPIEIELGEHSLKSPRASWGGRGGRVVIGADTIAITGIESRAGNASLVADATIVKATEQLEVKGKVQNLPIGMFAPEARGAVTATVDVKRRGITWNGKVKVLAHGVQLAPDLPAIDGDVAVTVAKRRVTADISLSTFQVGSVRLVLDVDGPRDITDPLAWRRLERKAIRTALLGITRLDLAAAKVSTGGIVEGELVLSGMETSGSFAVKGVETPLGTVAGEINFAPMGDELGLASTLRVANLGEAQIAGQIVIPAYPFEPAEWKRLGRGVLRVVTAQIDDVAIDPEKLATLGVDLPFRGRASVHVALAAGAGEAKATIDLRDVTGGLLVKPVDVRVEAGISPTQTTARVQARAAKKTDWADSDKRLATVTGSLPGFGFERWLADPGAVVAAPLEGRLEIPDIDVVPTLAMIGRADIQTGRLGGAIEVRGTAGKPTATGELVVSNVTVKPRLAGRKLPTLTELRIRPTWDGTVASLVIAGKESDGATLDIEARVRPDQLDKLFAKVVIEKFDIAPIAVFLPGPLVAATGKLSADVTINGLDVQGVRGRVALEKARVPIHPQVGTIREADLDVRLTNAGLSYKLAAKIGGGSLKLSGGARPDLKTITFGGDIVRFSPIGEIQPRVDARVDGTIFREDGVLRADARLTKTNVFLDMEQGVELLESEMPEDLFIGRKTAPPPTPKQARLPRKPWITIAVAVDSTPIYVKHEFFEVRARANARNGIKLLVGRTFGMDGSIEIERGDVSILGRKYRVDPGPDKIRFDGTADPLLAIRLTHDFPELTLTADIVGRATKRDIVMTGTPAIYTQDELFAFFIGGSPSGDAGASTRDVASNVGAAYVSAKLQRHAKKVIPFKFDVLTCDSLSCKLGRWITENWYIEFRQRIEPRPDEPPQEVQLEYYFRRNWLIEAAGFTERFGGDILWRKRW